MKVRVGPLLSSLFLASVSLSALSSPDSLEEQLRKIDQASPGNLGVYVKRLRDGVVIDYQGDRPWYLASTIKVPVGVAVLQKVQEGALSLDQDVTLKVSDFVDGSGEVITKKPGSKLKVRYLLEKMLTQSDSTAADLLIRLVGEEELNRRIKEKMVSSGFGPITTILHVRSAAYSEVHPSAEKLTNQDFIDLKRSKAGEARMQALRKKLGVTKDETNAKTLDQAFERYYEKGENTASLEAFALLLERLGKGELLNPEYTKLMLGFMEKMTTGENRLKAGLGPDVRFAQKTGTQHRRICNMGLVRSDSADTAVITACVEKFSDQKKAEAELKKVGQWVRGSILKL